MSDSFNKARLAKNTLFLYVRMIVLLAVGLYTSRVTLSALGVTDYGINNVVAGLVTMFVFINNAMMNSTQRYITYELGKGNTDKLKLIFSTSINIHFLIAIIIVILSETIGLWFLYNKLVIPVERMTAASWIFQLSVITCVISILSVPYNALIIAHERMSAFAYISLLDAGFKLIIAYLLMIYDGDRLILFGLLQLGVVIIDRVIYTVYCNRRFPESKYKYGVDKTLMGDMTKFAAWNLIGNLSWMCCTQGLTVLLNMFFNPIVNAARGLATTIQNAVANFSSSIEMAIKPQITKTYSQCEMSRMFKLVSLSARLCFYALLLVSLPICLETEQLLDLWLEEVPEYTSIFVRLTLLLMLIDSLGSPLSTAIQATGKLRKFQLSVGILQLFILPASYLSLILIPKPVVVYYVNLFVAFFIQLVKLWVVGNEIGFSIWSYITGVFLRTLLVLVLSVIIVIPFVAYYDPSILRMISVSFISCIVVVLLSYVIGINREEKGLIITKVRSFIAHSGRNK